LQPLNAFLVAIQHLMKNWGKPILLSWYISNTHAKEKAVVGVIVSPASPLPVRLSQVLQQIRKKT